jgi:hypothetical protein
MTDILLFCRYDPAPGSKCRRRRQVWMTDEELIEYVLRAFPEGMMVHEIAVRFQQHLMAERPDPEIPDGAAA